MKRLLAAALLLAGCATAPAVEDLSAYPAAIAGGYDNAAQFAAAPDDMKDAPAGPEDDWIDQQSVAFTVVSTPALAPAAVYVEWRKPDGTISKQRLWTFRRSPTGVILDIHELVYPTIYTGGDAPAFALLTASDVRSLPDGCGLPIRLSGQGAWNAQTDPEACTRNEAEFDIRVTVMPTGVLYQEQGRLPDGSYAFRTPSPAPYEFRRR